MAESFSDWMERFLSNPTIQQQIQWTMEAKQIPHSEAVQMFLKRHIVADMKILENPENFPPNIIEGIRREHPNWLNYFNERGWPLPHSGERFWPLSSK